MRRTRRPRLVGRCRRARCVMHAMHARVDSGHQPRKVSGAASRSLLALTRLAAWWHAPFPDLQRLSETHAAMPCALPRRCSYPTAARPRFSRACVRHLRRLQVPYVYVGGGDALRVDAAELAPRRARRRCGIGITHASHKHPARGDKRRADSRRRQPHGAHSHVRLVQHEVGGRVCSAAVDACAAEAASPSLIEARRRISISRHLARHWR
mmetsp:Transcript_8852/g.23826  ORF Transcript_8852/g.23826 Transcript_8852/m.23826 type:complete len:210 (-) Transcript_8852:144-773(-)